jgi:HD superfamily phosphohydrolase
MLGLPLISSGVVITDSLYGSVTLTEPVLIELIQSPPMQRLKGVMQYGVSSFLSTDQSTRYNLEKVTRFQHSIGAMLMVRRLGASIEEQAAALLHDVSHTAFSHVIDHVLIDPSGGSYHETHKIKYIDQTDLPMILTRYGLDPTRVLVEENFPLLERNAPALCADRGDYGLRDAVSFGTLSIDDARKILDSLVAIPNPHDPDRRIVMRDKESAVLFAEAYMNTDNNAYTDVVAMGEYKLAAEMIRRAVEDGIVCEADFWDMDEVFFDKIKSGKCLF